MVEDKCGVNKRLVFMYDENGAPNTVYYYNGSTSATKYYYVLNLQGDVTEIRSTSNALVAQYNYDAFGNILSIKDANGNNITSSTHIANVNPLRYRGYFYDTETGFYYLNSRYYDPATRRFISADDADILAVGQEELMNYNLYSYCFNNPVMYTDGNGNWPSWLTKVIVGTAVIAAAVAVSVATAGAASGTVVAAVHCVASGAAYGAITGAATGAVTGAASGALTHRARTGSWEGAGEAALNGAADGYMTGSISGAVTGGLTSSVCFAAGTAVLTATGVAAIENIRAGDMVWAADPETGERSLKRVVQIFENETDELVEITVGGETIEATPEHPFYVPCKGWTAAIQLRAGDILVMLNGDYVVVEQVQHEILEAPVKVFNFEVEDFHTYFVGESSVLVHNTCMPKNFYSSIKKAPGYSDKFVKAQNGLTKVNVKNKELLEQLNEFGTGWKKVYQNGWIDGQKVSYHYFQDATGKIFDFAAHYGKWS